MRILVICHIYVPVHNAGAERMQHEINKYLISQGHEVRVMLPNDGHPSGINHDYVFEGVYCFPRPQNYRGAIEWADVLISYLDLTQYAIKWALQFNRPLVWIAHNTYYHFYDNVGFEPNKVHVVYNSEAAKELSPFSNPSYVLPPPCDYRYYDLGLDCSKNEYITLINLNENKGAIQFYKLARKMPHRKFLAVKGAYDFQLEPAKDITNVTVINHQADIREVYKVTRILLMPSDYESWGRTATEAMCNGIPVIANPTFGLKENLGEAGIFCDRKNLDEWVKEIDKLDKPAAYKNQAEKCRKRSRELDPQSTLKGFEEYLISIKK